MTDRIAPYLRRIDACRIYSNFGPLVTAFEARLADSLGLPPGGVVTAANGTVALTAALWTCTGGRPGLCLLPSWTFAATAQAVRCAGLEPVFLDVDPATWRMRPLDVEAALARWPGVQAVIPVGAFGLPVDAAEWDALSERTGVPVVVDAAAGFATQKVGSSPTMISLHATKVLGVGEGALLASRDPDLVLRMRRTLNFGFPGRRVVEAIGLNGKMSEYAAAVGLAALDEWPEALADWTAAVDAYAEALAPMPLGRPEPRLISSTLVVELPGEADSAAEALRARGIDTRRWYSRGCHAEPDFRGCPAEPLPVTEILGDRCLGLPLAPDMSRADIATVAAALAEIS